MKKGFLFWFAILLVLPSYSQVVFEKGYLITDSDVRVECLIKNVDWKSNPTNISYKTNESSEISSASVMDTKEFGIYGVSKYERYTVDMDRSGDSESSMDDRREPHFEKEQLFLKVLVEGAASLYGYTEGNLTRFFYRTDDSGVQQLIYKRYKVVPGEGVSSSAIKIGLNNTYKQQLYNALKCSDITKRTAEKLEYNKGALIAFFVKYNECEGQEFVNYEAKDKRDFFNLSVRPGVNFTSLLIEQYSQFATASFHFDDQVNLRLGIEAEFVLGFNKNKWAVVAEPTYQFFSGQAKNGITTLDLEYKSIEFPVGLRYYMFLNTDSKFFVNAQAVFDYSMGTTLERDPSDDLDIRTVLNFTFGLGYKYQDKFSIEGRYCTPRDILSEYVFWHGDYNSFSVVLGYTLF